MGEDKGNGQGKKLQLDFEALGLEIDKEIDNLFVPAEEKRRASDPVQATAEAPSDKPVAGTSGSSPGQDDLQAEIDKQIDKLFQPASSRQSSASSTNEQPAFETGPSPEPVESEPLTPPASAPGRTHYISRSELPRYVEMLNAAYLSLDWEFSRENIQKLQSALADLEPYANSVPGSISIFKILRAILPRLGDKPESVNSRVVTLIRESQGLLAHMFLMEGPPGPAEKERLNALVSRFRQMKERALAARAARAARVGTQKTNVSEAGPNREPAPSVAGSSRKGLDEAGKQHISPIGSAHKAQQIPPQAEAKPRVVEDTEVPRAGLTTEVQPAMDNTEGEYPGASVVTREFVEEVSQPRSRPASAAEEESPVPEPSAGRMPDRWSLLELKDWMESSGHLLVQAIDGIDSEIERIRQLEAAFAKNPALAPIMLRLTEIRTGMERKVDSLRDQEGGWLNRIAWVESLQRISALYREEPEKGLERSTPPPVTSCPELDRKETRREDIYLFNFRGRSYGLPASNLVKHCQVSRKQMKLILKQGFCTLADVKPFFRGVRTGVVGQWSDMPAKALKSLRFDLVGAQV
ncbi:MAG: hypothetical protein AAGU11_16950, partial [Syntrophobacteraceae bacterium]